MRRRCPPWETRFARRPPPPRGTARGGQVGRRCPAGGDALRRAPPAPPVNGARLVMVDVGAVESCDGALAETLLSAHDDHCGDGDTVLVLAVRRRSASAAGRLL